MDLYDCHYGHYDIIGLCGSAESMSLRMSVGILRHDIETKVGLAMKKGGELTAGGEDMMTERSDGLVAMQSDDCAMTSFGRSGGIKGTWSLRWLQVCV